MAEVLNLLLLVLMGCAFGEIQRNKNEVQSVSSANLIRKQHIMEAEVHEKDKNMEEHLWSAEVSEATEKTEYFREEEGHRMAQITWNSVSGSPAIMDCSLFGEFGLIKNVLDNVHTEKVHSIQKSEMKKLIEICTNLPEYSNKPEPSLSQTFFSAKIKWRNILKSLAIYPGTKWCGAGNIAEHYEDLGASVETDICCRAHDHCNDTLPSGASKYGLTNIALFLKSHCDCDTTFKKCLLKARTNVSYSVGKIFFNLLQVQCFKNDHPIVSCLKYKGIPVFHWSCQEYALDFKKSLKWQFFDAEYYKEGQ